MQEIEEEEIVWKVDIPEKPLRPARTRQYLRRTLAENLPGILRRFLKDSTSRSVTQMRLVVELLETKDSEKRRSKGPLDLLLEELKEDDRLEAERAAAEGSAQESKSL